VSWHSATLLVTVLTCKLHTNYLKGSWAVWQKYIMELMLHNYISQKRFVLFWPHKWNNNIFVNSGAIYQAKCNRSLVMCQMTGWMRCVLARWRPTRHSSAVCRLLINWHIQDELNMYDNYYYHYCLSVKFCLSNGTAN